MEVIRALDIKCHEGKHNEDDDDNKLDNNTLEKSLFAKDKKLGGHDVRIVHGLVTTYLQQNRLKAASRLLAGSFLPKLRECQLDMHPDLNFCPSCRSIMNSTLLNIGSIHLFSGDCRSAKTTLLMAARHETKGVVPLMFLGLCLFACEEHDEANRMFLSALLMLENSDHTVPTASLSASYLMTGSFEKPNGSSKTAGKNFAIGTFLNNMGCVLYHQHSLEKATRWFLQALHIFHSEADSNNDDEEEDPSVVGMDEISSYAVPRRNSAFGLYKTSSSYRAHTAAAYCNLARTLVKLRAFGDAAVALERAVAIYKSMPTQNNDALISTMNSLAFVNTKLGKFRSALMTFEDMLQRMPPQGEKCMDPRTSKEDDIVKVLGKMRLVYLQRRDLQSAGNCIKRILEYKRSVSSHTLSLADEDDDEEEEDEEENNGGENKENTFEEVDATGIGCF